MNNKKIFVIEFCNDDAPHQWNSRINSEKYLQHAKGCKEAIETLIPGSEVVFNKVPKETAMAEIYCQLLQNFDDANPFYEQ